MLRCCLLLCLLRHKPRGQHRPAAAAAPYTRRRHRRRHPTLAPKVATTEIQSPFHGNRRDAGPALAERRRHLHLIRIVPLVPEKAVHNGARVRREVRRCAAVPARLAAGVAVLQRFERVDAPALLDELRGAVAARRALAPRGAFPCGESALYERERLA